MSKYVISLDVLVDVDSLQKAYQLGEVIQNLLADQTENKELFVSLEATDVTNVEEFDEDDGDELMYENLDQNN